MLVYDDEGLTAARAWLSRTGLADDGKLSDLVEAALRAVPRAKDKGEFARPEARILDSLRAALFEHLPAPVDDNVHEPAAQLTFDDDDGDDEDS
jgi:hypothetical protein